MNSDANATGNSITNTKQCIINNRNSNDSNTNSTCLQLYTVILIVIKKHKLVEIVEVVGTWVPTIMDTRYNGMFQCWLTICSGKYRNTNCTDNEGAKEWNSVPGYWYPGMHTVYTHFKAPRHSSQTRHE